MMPDQPQDDYCNEVHQVILDLAEQFRSKIPRELREKALDYLIWECVDGEEKPYSETLPEGERIPF